MELATRYQNIAGTVGVARDNTLATVIARRRANAIHPLRTGNYGLLRFSAKLICREFRNDEKKAREPCQID